MVDKLIEELSKYNDVDKELVRKAYLFAKKAHEGQIRDEGEDYFVHPYNVAFILARMKADQDTVIAALLHDVIEDAKISPAKIRSDFGEDVANIITSLTKLDWNYFKSAEEYTAENMRKILLAADKDPRVILIKLADRLHNLTTAGLLKNNEKKKWMAEETMNVYVPLAYKLGINTIKDKMQDLCFKYLSPSKYHKVSEQVMERVEYLKPFLKDIIDRIIDKLKHAKIPAKIYWRTKSFYSTYQKMQKYECPVEEVYDLCALRIVTDTISNCYAAEILVRELGKPFEKFGNLDYIKNPKPNGYRSLHLLMEIKKNIFEFQIRTREMNNDAEYGFMHWQYKQTAKDGGLDKKMVWLRQILEWQKKSKDAKDFLKNAKIDLFHKEIIVFTPKGDALHLPEGSTPVDFAYAVHSELGNQCDKATVNGKLVPLDYLLNSGDKVSIISSKNRKPSREWLKFVKSGKAKEKIRKALGIFLDPFTDKEKQSVSYIEDLTKFLNVNKKNIKISKCCNPSVSDRIVAFYTKDKKITVHKETCSNIYTLDERRKLNIGWKNVDDDNKIKINLKIEDRPGIISDILDALSKSNVRVTSLDTSSGKKNEIDLVVTLELLDGADHKKLKSSVGGIKGVLSMESAVLA